MFICRKFYEDHNVEYIDGDSPQKHARHGWINKECPFCTGNPGHHLGFNETTGYFRCWRCGFHPIEEVIKELLKVPWSEAKELKRYYGGRAGRTKPVFPSKTKDIQVALPEEAGPLKKAHKEYLRARRFNPKVLEEVWDLFGTGNKGRYRNRIIAPIYFNNELISYQGRDVTGEQELRYKACRRDEEKISHQEVLYGYDLCDKKNGIVVEGITDAWRLGPGALSTFGIGVSHGQLRLLSTFDNVYVLRDFTDPQAYKEACQLIAELALLGVSTEMIWIEKGTDPADLSQEEADWLTRELLL